MRRWKLALFFILAASGIQAQNTIGLPDIINYPKKTYAAGLQNWDIQQDELGIIYVANNEGLLAFDGQFWNLYPLPNRTITRSITIGNNQRIYVGGQDELGFFAPGRGGRLEYQSLVKLIPDTHKSFGDVWDICSFQNEIWFRTSRAILKYTGKAFAIYETPSEWGFMGVYLNRLYAQDIERGLLTFENNAWRLLQTTNTLPQNDVVTGIVGGSEGRLLISMQKNGLFALESQTWTPLSSPLSLELKKNRIYAAAKIDDKRIAIGTSNGGVYIVDPAINFIQHFSSKEGLQNNNTLSILVDRDANLWLGLDNGIDYIAFNSAIKQIIPGEQKAAGYSALIRNKHLYVGTSNGAYITPLQEKEDLSFSQGSFSPIANTTGQVWSLQEINDKILVGHHEGAFQVNGTTAQLVSDIAGYWNFIPKSGTYPSKVIIAGNYKGIQNFSFENDGLVPTNRIADFDESSRYLAIDEMQNIWVSHPYHGIFKIQKKEDSASIITKYDIQKGLPSLLNNHVFKIKEKILVATEKGIYEYLKAEDRFLPASEFSTLLGSQSIRYLKEDPMGNIWFFHEKNLGVIENNNTEGPKVTFLPEFNNRLLSGFEFIYTHDNQNIFLAGETGVYHLNFEKYKNQKSALGVNIRSVRIRQEYDSLLFGGYLNKSGEQKSTAIDKDWKSIRFEFSAPPHPYAESLEYSYRLKGYNTRWSEWTKRKDKEYTNLPKGEYVFEVKVRNNFGIESPVSQFAFTILPAWYETQIALITYLLMGMLTLTWAYKWQQKKFRKQKELFEAEQKKILYIHDLERTKAETALMTLRNENLESEIQFKNSELAASAMHLVKKGELISKIKSELHQLAKRIENAKAENELKKMIKELSGDEQIDLEWEHFAKHFDKVHSDFVMVVKNKHPEISPSELKLCAYLRMNLSSKEIAQLLNISVRGVEISRYRLRKKLNLASGENLFDYLIQLHKN